MSKRIEDEIEDARLAIEGALANPDLLKCLVQVGFDRKKVLEGKALLEKTKMMWENMKHGYGNQRNATDHLYATRQEANALYMKHVKLARMAVPFDRNLWRRLELSGTRMRSWTGWLRQTEAFYTNIVEVLDKMAAYGVTNEELAQAEAMVQAIAASRVKQNRGKGAAQHAKKERDKALDELRQWMRRYMRTIHFAFEGDKQQMEALGVVVPS